MEFENTREKLKTFLEGEARGMFSNSRRYYQISEGLGNSFANSLKNIEFLAYYVLEQISEPSQPETSI